MVGWFCEYEDKANIGIWQSGISGMELPTVFEDFKRMNARINNIFQWQSWSSEGAKKGFI
jgi:hypothetical protein